MTSIWRMVIWLNGPFKWDNVFISLAFRNDAGHSHPPMNLQVQLTEMSLKILKATSRYWELQVYQHLFGAKYIAYSLKIYTILG